MNILPRRQVFIVLGLKQPLCEVKRFNLSPLVGKLPVQPSILSKMCIDDLLQLSHLLLVLPFEHPYFIGDRPQLLLQLEVTHVHLFCNRVISES